MIVNIWKNNHFYGDKMAKLAIENEEFQFSDAELNHLTHEAMQRYKDAKDESIALPAADNWDLAMGFADQIGLFTDHGAVLWRKGTGGREWVIRWNEGSCQDSTGPRCLCKAIIDVTIFPPGDTDEKAQLASD